MSDSRETKLVNWVSKVLGDLLPEQRTRAVITLVSGDASFRRYFRVRVDDSQFIAVDAPPDKENSKTFVRVSNLFRAAGVTVPKILATDYTQGFLLLEDFGDELYLNKLVDFRSNKHKGEIGSLYQSAIDSLINIQSKVNIEKLDPYNENMLLQEMSLFEEWFCQSYLNLDLNCEAKELIAGAQQFLLEAALSQPQVAVHRDYHSRNLLILNPYTFGESATPGIIDFQDAVCGPYTYDLVSLLRDAYIQLDPKFVDTWAFYYLKKVESLGIIQTIDKYDFFRDFDLMGLQRQLKVIGIFARLHIRDNKPRYLADIPLVIRYFLDVSQRYTELEAFSNWFRHTVEPIVATKL